MAALDEDIKFSDTDVHSEQIQGSNSHSNMDKGKKRRTSSRRKRLDVENLSKSTRDKSVASVAQDGSDKVVASTSRGDSDGPSRFTRKKAVASTSSANKSPEKARPASPGSSKHTSVESVAKEHAADKSGKSPSRPGAASPEPNCAICLGKLENKSFTDSCFHMFCFVCLVEWSKVKAECPLCKQSFKSIIHNLKSYKEYDQYNIPQPEDRLPQMHEFAAPGGIRFRYRTTVTDHRYAHLADRIDQEIQRQLLQRPSRRAPVPNWRRLRQPANSEFRRSIYTQHMQCHNGEQSRARRRVRDTSPSFFRSNPAQTHRLVPWLNRELTALLQGQGDHMAFVLELIMGLITRYRIDSVEFHEHVLPYIGRFTRHFQEEFLAFAKSPYHMAAYDRHVRYEPREVHDEGSDSERPPEGAAAAADDSDDSDIIVVSPSSPHQRNTVEPRRPADDDLVPWGRRIMTVGNPSYLGFAPIVRSFRQDDLSQGLDLGPGRRFGFNAAPGASQWDSPTHGPSALLDDLNVGATASTSRHHIIWSPTSSSTSAPATPGQPSSSSVGDRATALSSWDGDTPWPMPTLPPISETTMPASLTNFNANSLPPISSWPSTSQNDPIVCQESGTEQSSNESDVEIVNYEKPWADRSPIKLSSGEESDFDVMITGSSYANDPVKKERKSRHREREQETSQNSTLDDSIRKRPRDDSSDTSKKSSKRRHHGRSAESHSNVSRPIPPISPSDWDYQQNLLSAMMPAKIREKHNHSYSFETRSSPSSSDSDSQSKHVSIHSHKHRKSSRHSHIEILEYKRKSKKHKKSSKSHRKDSSRNDGEDREERQRKDKYRDKERYDSDKTHKSKHSKHKKKKSKDKKHRSRDKKRDSSPSPLVSRRDEKSSTISDSSDTGNFYEKFSVVMKEISNIAQRKTHEISDSASDGDMEHTSTAVIHEGKQVNDTRETSNRNSSNSKCKSVTGPSMPEKLEVNTVDQKSNSSNIQNFKSVNETQTTSPRKQPSLDTSQFEFVELSSMQAAVFDQELDSVTKSLMEGNLDSLLGNSETSTPRHFKKHPHGHKKSGKKLPSTGTMASAKEDAQIENSNQENTIQSNDVSSCTDFDANTDFQLPPFLSFVDTQEANRNAVAQSCVQNIERSHVDSTAGVTAQFPPETKLLSDVAHGTSSPISLDAFGHIPNIVSAPSCHVKELSRDVDTVSTDSDIDVVGEAYDNTYLSIPCYKSSHDNVMPSFSSVNDLTCARGNNLISSPKPGCSADIDGSQNFIDVLGISESDSDSQVEFVGEEHEKIDITEESDGEKSEGIDVLTYDSDIDIIGNSDEDIIIDSGANNIVDKPRSKVSLLSVDLESDSTDLDYQCEEEDSVDKNSVNNYSQRCSYKTPNDGSEVSKGILGKTSSTLCDHGIDNTPVINSNIERSEGTSILSENVYSPYNVETDVSNKNRLRDDATVPMYFSNKVQNKVKETNSEMSNISEDNDSFSDINVSNITVEDNGKGPVRETGYEDSVKDAAGNVCTDIAKCSTDDHAGDNVEVDIGTMNNSSLEEKISSDPSDEHKANVSDVASEISVERSESQPVQSSQDESAISDEAACSEGVNWTQNPAYEPQSPAVSPTDSRPRRVYGDTTADSSESSPSSVITPPYVASLYEASGSQGYFPFRHPFHSSRSLLHPPSSPEDYYDNLAPED